MPTFDQQILDALAGELDPKVFEDCACDLLRDEFPGLFPIRGGCDAGMDGGIADGEGEAFPLVCTTSTDVIGNLTESLDSYLKEGGRRRKVVMATSDALTPQRRRRLEKRAREKDFVLCGPYDRHAFKDRLYRNPHWCLKLLGLTGEPSALSTVPRTLRPLPELDRVGREADLAWLRQTEGDRLLVGQPGSGKTYLLRQLVRDGGAFFLVSEDRTAIANALREEKPALVIVDDAQRDPALLETLRHLRSDLGASFSILATCWPGAEDEVRTALALASGQVRRLELMTRREILTIVEQVAGDLSTAWQRLLVDQATNKPGLAATLAWLCLRGDWHEVATGEALWRQLEPSLGRQLGHTATDFLGYLSLAGRHGMPVETAGEFLGLSRQKVREMALDIAAAGVLREMPDRRLAVEPSDLRSVVVKRTFFTGPAPHDHRQLLDRVPDRDSAIFEIVRAVHRGAEVPGRELRDLVRQTTHPDAWRAIAALEDHARWALENSPIDPLDLVREAFTHAPREVVRILLDRAASDTRPLHSNPDHPLRRLQDWLQAPISKLGEILRRRRLAIDAVERFFADHDGEDGKVEVAVHAGCLALSPRLQGAEPDALDDKVLIRSGILPPAGLAELGTLWKRVFALLPEIDLAIWTHLREMLHPWIRPSAMGDEPDPKIVETAHAFAVEMLQDLRTRTGDHQGFRAELRGLASRVGLDLAIEVDPLFELLYVEDVDSAEALRELEEQKRQKVEQLADEWRSLAEPRRAARDLARFERHSTWVHGPASDWAALLCSRLAETVEAPHLWLEALIDEEAPSRLLPPFLDQTAKRRLPGWEDAFARCFARDELVGAAVWTVCALPDPPRELLDLAVEHAPRFSPQLAVRCLRGEIPLENLRALLATSDPHLAIELAHSEWRAAPRGSFREEVREACRAAILRSADAENLSRWSHDSYLGDVLENEPDLALDWLRERLDHDTITFLFPDDDYHIEARVLSGLRKDQKLSLLELLDSSPTLEGSISVLVDQDTDLYRKLLDQKELERYHLEPLERKPDEAWTRLALVALDHGFEPARVAFTALNRSCSSWGSEQDYWRPWEEAFAGLETHPDDRLREVGRVGREEARARITAAAEDERERELHGR